MKNRIRLWFRFIGPQVARLQVLGIVVGIVLFFSEFLFAFLLQLFLFQLGAFRADQIHVPEFLMRLDFKETLAAMILGGGFLRGAMNYMKDYLRGSAAEVFTTEHRVGIVRWVFSSRSVSSGEVLSIFGDQVQAGKSFIASLQQICVQATTLVFLIGSLFVISPLLTFAGVIALGVFGFSLRALDRAISKVGDGLTAESTSINHRITTSIRNLMMIQIYGTQKRECDLAEANLGRSLRLYLRYFRLAGIKMSASQTFGLIIICVISILSRDFSILVPSMLISYFYLFVRFVSSFAEVNFSVSNMALTWPMTRKMKEWTETVAVPRSASDMAALNQKPVSSVSIAGEVQKVGWKLQDISFGYDARMILDRFTLEVQPGSSLVIMGPSGVGKSTLLALMIGMYTPTRGRVQVLSAEKDSSSAKEPPKEIELETIRLQLLRRIGYVGPDTFLIDGTIRENLQYGNTESSTTDAALWEACRQAECDFISELPQGLDHRLTEQGQGLSAGQKQRLSLARALVRKPKALILDEATANLDAMTEKRLIDSMRKLKGEMTLIVVTHRESLLELADQVVRLG